MSGDDHRSRFDFIDIDLDDPQPPVWVPGSFDGARVVARRDGVPVGARLFVGRVPRSMAALESQLPIRDGELPPASTPISVTVAVCTRDRPSLLSRCLAAIGESIDFAGAEVSADILVIDNASPNDRTSDAALSGGARCVREPVPGLDVARNRAVCECRGDVIAFVDDDVVVDRSWIRTVARSFGADPTIDALTGGVLAHRLDTPAQVDFERSGGFLPGWKPVRYAVGLQDDVPFRTGIGAGCNMAFRRSLFERIGLFDEALDTGRPMPGGGDLDIFVRTMMHGLVAYEPSAVVFHEHRREWHQLRYQYYSWGKGWGALLAKWYRRAPQHRAKIRWVAWRSMRGYGRDLLKGPERSGLYRRWHCVLLAVGFTVGAAGSYERSQRRMQQRRREAVKR